MIKYHGMPLGGTDAVAAHVLRGRHAFVSWRWPDQLAVAVEVCQSFAIDNGAFSDWNRERAGPPDWADYCAWIREVARLPSFDFAVIPDVPDGTVDENAGLIDQWVGYFGNDRTLGAPVWHLNEPVSRLRMLAIGWPRVCLGSTGAFATPGTPAWWGRMNDAMVAGVCDLQGRPTTKLHGLRMLSPDIFTKLPLASADSTNVARNAGMDTAWRGPYKPVSQAGRAQVLCERIEAHNGAVRWDTQAAQQSLQLMHTEGE